jgi:hypothetical protein
VTTTIVRPDLFLDVDMDAVPVCESGEGCDRQAVWNVRKWCGCSVLFCEPCRVAHWQEIQALDRMGGIVETARCMTCPATKQLDPSKELYWQLVTTVTPL